MIDTINLDIACLAVTDELSEISVCIIQMLALLVKVLSGT